MRQLFHTPVLHFDDANGRPLVGGRLYSYKAGTSTPVNLYRNETGNEKHTNPIVLNMRGECVAYGNEGVAYKLVLNDRHDVTIWERDNVYPAGGGSGGGTDINVSYDDENKALVFSNDFEADDPQETNEVEKIVDGAGLEFAMRDPTKESLANKVTSVRNTDEATDTNYPSEHAVSVGFAALAAAISTLWTNAVAAFQTIANKVTSIRAVSSASDDKYPSEKAVSIALADKEDKANKVTSWSSTTTNVNYPSEKLVKESLDGKINTSDVDAALSTTSTNPLQNKEVTRWHNIVLGDDGYFSGSSALPQLSLVKSVLGSLSLYNAGVNVKIYSFDENDEENATLEWDSANASGTVKTNFDRGQQTGTLFTSAPGKWVKITYTGSTSSYFRGLGIFMNTRGSASSNKNFYGRLRVGTTEYPWSSPFLTSGSLVTTVYSATSVTSAQIILKPISSDASCAIYGFRCLNTYNGSEDAVLIGTSTFAYKLRNSRKLAVSLSNISTDTSFNGADDVTNIKTTGTLGVGNGGTGKTTVTSGNYLVGNGSSALTEKTPKDAGSDVLKSLDTDNGDVVDGDFIVTSYHVNESTISSTTFVRRTAVKLWNYIKSKLSGSDVNIGGNAATATTAQNYDANTGTIRSALALKSDTGHVHNTDANEVTYSADASTLDVVTDTTEIVTTNTAGYGNSSTQDKKLYRRPIKSKLWPWIKGLLSSDTGVNVSGSSASCTGNAATASAAASGSALETAINGKAASSHTHKTDAADVTSDDTNLGDATDGMQFITTYADNTGYSSQHKELYRRPGIKIWNWIKSKIDSYTGVVHTTGDETVQGLKTFSNTTTGNDLDVNLQSVTNNGTFKMGVEIAASGRRGLWDYGGTGIAGEGKWIIFKDTDNVVHVGDASAEPNTIRLGKLTIDTSGTIGNASNTLYIG